MEMILLVGAPGAGKSTFARRFLDSHLRINLDMLRTRHRERGLFEACLRYKQPCIVDNTNPTAEERARYILPARAARFRVTGYFFEQPLETLLARNAMRTGKSRIPDAGVRSVYAKLAPPQPEEGFDLLYRAVPGEEGAFDIFEICGKADHEIR